MMRERWPEEIAPAAKRLALLMKFGGIVWVLYMAMLAVRF